MIPHDRCHRDRALHLLDPDEELRPLQTILAVIYEVTHTGKELCVRVACPREMCELLPIRVVTRLGVREDQHFVRLTASRCIECLPVRRRTARCDAVLIPRPRHQTVKLCHILIDLNRIIRKALIRHGIAAHDFRLSLHTHLDRLLLDGRCHLPHQDAPPPCILCHDLPQTLNVQHTRELAQCRIPKCTQPAELPECRTAKCKYPRCGSHLDKPASIHYLVLCHPSIPLYVYFHPKLTRTACSRKRTPLPSVCTPPHAARDTVQHPRS